jgi:transposase
MPGVLRQVLIRSEISFFRLSVGCEANHFLRFAGSRHLLPRGFDGGLSFVGRKCRVRPPIVPPRPPFSLRGPGDPQRRNPWQDRATPYQRRVRGLSGPSRGFPASRTRDPRHRRQSRDSQNAKLVDEFPARYPQVHIHFTPTYSSWLNQVEVWFAKIQRQVIARGIFSSVDDLRRKILRYIRHYNKTATPIRWTYSTPANRIKP